MAMTKEQLLLQSKDDLADTIIEAANIIQKLEKRLKQYKNEADELWHKQNNSCVMQQHQMGR